MRPSSANESTLEGRYFILKRTRHSIFSEFIIFFIIHDSIIIIVYSWILDTVLTSKMTLKLAFYFFAY